MKAKTYSFIVLTGFLLTCILCNPVIAQITDLESAWTNEGGSTLYIENIDTEGQVTGYYINRVRGFSCQNTAYPVVGWYYPSSNIITWTVKWENSSEQCNSLTSWTGLFNPGFNTISTLWQLVVNGNTSTGQILQGENTFRRTAAITNASLKNK